MIRLRFLQLYRGAAGIGLFRVLLLAVILLPLVSLFLVQHIADYPWRHIVPVFLIYIVWLVHQRRKDYFFLLSVIRHPQKLFVAEYFIFTLPVIALMLTAALYVQTFLCCGILVLIALQRPLRVLKAPVTLKLRIIPTGMFEWQSGFRKNLVPLVIFFIPGLFGFYREWLSAVSLFFITMMFLSFYSEYEPRHMLAADGRNSWHFLVRKLTVHVGSFALIVLPLFIMAMIQGDHLWLKFGYFAASLNLLTFSILLKYYQYRPAAISGAHQMVVTLACFISVLLPMAVLIFLVNILLAAGANATLKDYLYD
jgi:hypothetical protein